MAPDSELSKEAVQLAVAWKAFQTLAKELDSLGDKIGPGEIANKLWLLSGIALSQRRTIREVLPLAPDIYQKTKLKSRVQQGEGP